MNITLNGTARHAENLRSLLRRSPTEPSGVFASYFVRFAYAFVRHFVSSFASACGLWLLILDVCGFLRRFWWTLHLLFAFAQMRHLVWSGFLLGRNGQQHLPNPLCGGPWRKTFEFSGGHHLQYAGGCGPEGLGGFLHAVVVALSLHMGILPLREPLLLIL